MQVQLTGTEKDPLLQITFRPGDRHTGTGEDMSCWVHGLPSASRIAVSRDADDQIADMTWQLHTLSAANILADAGYTVPAATTRLIRPLAGLHPNRSGYARVLPRLTDVLVTGGLLPDSARYDPASRSWELPITDLALVATIDLSAALQRALTDPVTTEPAASEPVSTPSAPAIPALPKAAPVARPFLAGRDPAVARAAQIAACSDGTGIEEQIAILTAATGGVPDWFGLELDPFQLAGALAAAAGHTLLGDAPGLGKGSPDWVRILTPHGWTTYGQIRVGDEVIGRDGRPTQVIGVYPRGELDVYRVTMTDGASVVVDGDHLWEVGGKEERARDLHARLRSTRELIEEGTTYVEGGTPHARHAHFIPMVGPVKFAAQAPLPLDPYVLGVLLGDGCFMKSSISLTSVDEQILDEVRARLAPMGCVLNQWPNKRSAAISYGISGPGGRSKTNPLMAIIRNWGMAPCGSPQKHVPPEYLTAPVADRLELLRGLMDSDGEAGAAAGFCSTSLALVEGMEFLVQSLGGSTRRSIKHPHSRNRHGVRVDGLPAYRLTVGMPAEFNPFMLERKALAWHKPWKYPPMRAIRTIEPAGRGNVICIAVAAQDQLYVTEGFIVTHNTRQILCAAAILAPRRVIILTPPTVVTHWQRATYASGLADHPGAPGGQVLAFRSTRKIPDLPDTGVLIVPDTLIASRPALLAQLVAWGPEVVALDEAHRIKTWDSKRGRACRRLALAATRLRIAASGTPMFANTEELAAPLEFAGLLGPVFGGYKAYTAEYARFSKFGWTARKAKLPQLKANLDAHCWVRRRKDQAMKDLPPKRRVAEFIDIDVKLFTESHTTVNRQIDTWLRRFQGAKKRAPSNEEIDEWAAGEVGLVTLMRKAAGMAKIPAAVTMVTDWVRDTTEEDAAGQPVYTRPLIVWTHHHEVSEAMATALPETVGTARSIIGGTPQDERTRIVDDFQAGKVPVLVASIHAAGVGLTLTAASECWFVESDFTPAIVSQAEDRIHRRGATRPVTITTLIAPGTLDEQIQRIQAKKAATLEAVMTGADHHTAVATPGAAERSILSAMVVERLARKSAAAAARRKGAAS